MIVTLILIRGIQQSFGNVIEEFGLTLNWDSYIGDRGRKGRGDNTSRGREEAETEREYVGEVEKGSARAALDSTPPPSLAIDSWFLLPKWKGSFEEILTILLSYKRGMRGVCV